MAGEAGEFDPAAEMRIGFGDLAAKCGNAAGARMAAHDDIVHIEIAHAIFDRGTDRVVA